MKANKRLGQNFLRDEKILQKIVDFAQIEKGDAVVEVGPGEGTLTKLLLEKAGNVVAVEKDGELIDKLKERFRLEIKNSKLKILNGDILDIENLLKTAKLKIENYCLVGNIPYYITGEIFRKFLESSNQPKSLTFVVQKEVADRIMGSHSAKASRDKKKESILSLSIKAYGKPEYGGIIKAGSFSPRPKVDSAIIAVRDISRQRFEEITHPNPLLLQEREPDKKSSEKTFFEIIKKGFAHKRKLLAKNLGIDQSILLELGIKEKARAEDLKLEDWLNISKYLHTSGHPQKK